MSWSSEPGPFPTTVTSSRLRASFPAPTLTRRRTLLLVVAVILTAASVASVCFDSFRPLDLLRPLWGPQTGGVQDIKSWVPPWAKDLPANTRVLRQGVANEFDTTKVTYYSQDEEDRHLFSAYFNLQFDGFYIELGAIDGIEFSNTKFLADHLGWRGLLIEPSPGSFDRLVQNRHNDLCLRAAICSRRSQVDYIMENNGSAINGILEFMAPEFRHTWHPDVVMARLQGRIVQMPCVPLQSILDFYKIKVVDFWSLDVEGAELEVLKTVDFDRTHFSVIAIEFDGTSPAKEADIEALLTARGFVSRGAQTRNSHWFTHHDFKPFAKSLNTTLRM